MAGRTVQAGEMALYLFHQGTNFRAHAAMGAHPCSVRKTAGWRFRVWAPNAAAVYVTGDFNGWDAVACPMAEKNGVWEAFVPGAKQFDNYKYRIVTKGGDVLFKADPFAFHAETRPATASKLYDLSGFSWSDGAYFKKQDGRRGRYEPMNAYQMDIGSFARHPDGTPYSYRELAKKAVPYLSKMGYTHINLLPVYEYPLDDSLGYQATGYFAPTSRYGTPKDFMAFVDAFHEAGLGVIMDWLPCWFPKDGHGLFRFDGTPLFEYADPRRGEHPALGAACFDFGKNEVKSFLISSALYWLEQYHLDGLRLPHLSSILYLDYNRVPGEWSPNIYGGSEHLEAAAFLRELNQTVAENCPRAFTIGEETTAWPMLTRPVREGGMGFTYKWNTGWLRDMLRYASLQPAYRLYNQDALTYGLFYAFSENFILPLPHYEATDGKGSFIGKITDSYEHKFDTMRLLLGYMAAYPGKKLIFMGQEFGQFREWDFRTGLDWQLLDVPRHKKLQAFVRDLNHVYKETPALWQADSSAEDFLFLTRNDTVSGVLSFLRRAEEGGEVVAVCNFGTSQAEDYLLGVPKSGSYRLTLHSAWEKYGGSQPTRVKSYKTKREGKNGYAHSIRLTLPALSFLLLQWSEPKEK